MAKEIKIKSIDNEKSEKASLVFFEGDEYKQAVFLPKSIIEVDADNTLTCSIDDVLDAAIEKAKEENNFNGNGGDKMVVLEDPSWDVEGRNSIGFDISIFDNGKKDSDFKVRVFLPRSKIEDNAAPFWLVCSSIAQRVAEESKKKFGDNGISQAILGNPNEFEFKGLTTEKVTGKDIKYQLNKRLEG